MSFAEIFNLEKDEAIERASKISRRKKKLSIADKKRLVETINRSTETHHLQLYNLLKFFGVQYNQNNNGIFLDLNSLDDKIVLILYYYVFQIMKLKHNKN